MAKDCAGGIDKASGDGLLNTFDDNSNYLAYFLSRFEWKLNLIK